MASNSRSSRQIRRKLEPISIAELAGDSTMTGFSDLFRIPTTPELHPDPEGLTPRGGQANIDLAQTAAHVPDLQERPLGLRPRGSLSQSGLVPDRLSPTVSESLRAPDIELGQRYIKRGHPKIRVREIREVQDALTAAGQLLYLAMYGSYREEASVKICRKGYRELADRAHIHMDTVRDLLDDFKEKGIIREIGTFDSKANLSKTYEVLSFSAIKDYWRQAGIHFVTAERKPALCDALGNKLSGPRGSPTQRVLAREAVKPSGPMGIERTGPVGVRPTPLDKKIILDSSSTTVRAFLQSELATFDDAAVDLLWADCRRQVPDVTAEEVASLFQRKLPESRARGIENPNGFLLRAVARSCTAAAIGALRQGREVPKEVPLPISSEELENALNDPHTPLQLRAWIEQRLQEKKD